MNAESHSRILTGVVVSTARQKTITVRVDRKKTHPKYRKYIKLSSKFHAHDESGKGKLGDVVRIKECPPRSKTKAWELVDIVENAK